MTAYDLESKSEVMVSRGHPLFIQIPDLGWLYLLVLLSALVPLCCISPDR